MERPIEPKLNPDLVKLREQIDQLVFKEEKRAEIAPYIQDPESFQYSLDYPNAFVKSHTTSFPVTILSQLENPKVDYKMGLLPSIQQAWFTTGFSLYMWNYQQNPNDVEVFRYESPTDRIDYVDVLHVSNTHVELYIATKNSIYLHRIALPSNDNDKLKLTTNYIIKTNGIVLTDITPLGTSAVTNRSFLKGDDGHLYELQLKITDKILHHQLIHLTASPLVYYLPSIFKTVSPTSIRSIVVDTHHSLLYTLRNDSSIHVADVSENGYQPLVVFTELLSLISLHISGNASNKPILVAVTQDGQRHYLHYSQSQKAMSIKFTLPSPPIPGSLLFNALAEEQLEQSYIDNDHLVFGASLSKADKKHFVLTACHLVEETAEGRNYVQVCDVYHEDATEKIWSIVKGSTTRQHTNSTLENTDNEEYLVLTASGIVHYMKQTSADFLEQALATTTPASFLKYTTRYGSMESNYMAYVLGCSGRSLDQISSFLHQSAAKEEGLLLYYTRIIKHIWRVSLSEGLCNETLKSAQDYLTTLLKLITHMQIPIQNQMYDMLNRSLETIHLFCFLNDFNWNEISKKTNWEDIRSYSRLVNEENGAIVLQNIIFTAIHVTAKAGTDGMTPISDFLAYNSTSLYTQDAITYFKGIEYLMHARSTATEETDKKQLCINHCVDCLSSIVHKIDSARLEPICTVIRELGCHIDANKLLYAKIQSEDNTIDFSNLHEHILHPTLRHALETKDKEYLRQLIIQTLALSTQSTHHFDIYQWLLSGNEHLLIELEEPDVLDFLHSLSAHPTLKYSLLHAYHVHRKQYELAVQDLYDLALCPSSDKNTTHAVTFNIRHSALRKTHHYFDLAKQLDADLKDSIEYALATADVQQNIQKSLLEKGLEQEAIALNDKLLKDRELLEEFAYTHDLYEEALMLLDLMKDYNSAFVREAYEKIVDMVQTEEDLKDKIVEIAGYLYPSIISFPVYIIFEILNHKHGASFAFSVLEASGVPTEVISEAEKESIYDN